MALFRDDVQPGQPYYRALGFNAGSVRVDNYTGYWLYFPKADAYVPPYYWSAILEIKGGAGYGEYLVQSPFATNQSPTKPGYFVHLTWSDMPLPPTPGGLVSDVVSPGVIPAINVNINFGGHSASLEGSSIYNPSDVLVTTASPASGNIGAADDIEMSGGTNTFVIVGFGARFTAPQVVGDVTVELLWNGTTFHSATNSANSIAAVASISTIPVGTTVQFSYILRKTSAASPDFTFNGLSAWFYEAILF